MMKTTYKVFIHKVKGYRNQFIILFGIILIGGSCRHNIKIEETRAARVEQVASVAEIERGEQAARAEHVASVAEIERGEQAARAEHVASVEQVARVEQVASVAEIERGEQAARAEHVASVAEIERVAEIEAIKAVISRTVETRENAIKKLEEQMEAVAGTGIGGGKEIRALAEEIKGHVIRTLRALGEAIEEISYIGLEVAEKGARDRDTLITQEEEIKRVDKEVREEVVEQVRALDETVSMAITDLEVIEKKEVIEAIEKIYVTAKEIIIEIATIKNSVVLVFCEPVNKIV